MEKKASLIKNCASEARRDINALLNELSDYVEKVSENCSRGWFNVSEISDLDGMPVIKAKMILEDDLGQGKVNRKTYDVAIRRDFNDEFTYNVGFSGEAVYYVCNGMITSYKEII